MGSRKERADMQGGGMGLLGVLGFHPEITAGLRKIKWESGNLLTTKCYFNINHRASSGTNSKDETHHFRYVTHRQM